MDTKSIYLAGGCFWGVQEYFNRVKGVVSTVAGYANGHFSNPTYEQVCEQETGFAETVEVTYDPEKISLFDLLNLYFRVVDPISVNRQGNDVGTQYRTGIYTTNEEDFMIADEFLQIKVCEIGPLAVELKKLENFFYAEEYHQNYLKKNPQRHCNIDLSIAEISHKKQFAKPNREMIREMLSPMEYKVTQESYTESPFSNEINDKFERGIYVDVVSGAPLFSSEDKFRSNCGWPAFSKPIESGRIMYNEDRSVGLKRVEVTSYDGNSHLGHVFKDGPVDRGGLRYCINGAALRFIPYDKMEELGYKEWMDQV